MLKKQKHYFPSTLFLLILLFIIGSIAVFSFLNVLPRLLDNKNFQVLSASSYPLKSNIAINALLKINFTKEVVEALENGIPLTIAVEVQVFYEKTWWRNVLIKESVQRFELRYHPLTDIHEVKNIATYERYSFNSRQEAMAILGTIQGAQLIEKNKLEANKEYFVQIRTLLDISYLPAALRQLAAVSSTWRLESSWYRWAIMPIQTEQIK